MSEQTHLVIAKAISDLGNITLYTADEIGSILYPRTPAEIAAGVTPTSYFYPPGNVLRYGTNTTPGTTDMVVAFTSAISSNLYVTVPAGTYKISGNLLIPPYVIVEGAGLNNTSVVISTDAVAFVLQYWSQLKGLSVSKSGSHTKNLIEIGSSSLDGGRAVIVDVRATGAGNDGIQLIQGNLGLIQNVVTDSNGRDGINFKAGNANLNAWTLNGYVDTRGNVRDGLNIERGSAIGDNLVSVTNTLIGVTAQQNGRYGIYIGTRSNTVVGGYGELNTTQDIYLDQYARGNRISVVQGTVVDNSLNPSFNVVEHWNASGGYQRIFQNRTLFSGVAAAGLGIYNDDGTAGTLSLFKSAAATYKFQADGTGANQSLALENNQATFVLNLRTDGTYLAGAKIADSALAGVLGAYFDGSAANGEDLQDTNSTNGGTFVRFLIGAKGSGSAIGSITRNAATSAVLYNTSSDARLKDIVGRLDAGALIDAIKVYDFTWKQGGAHDRGVVAQELVEVVPQAVQVGAEDPWGVDYSKLVPLLIAEVQALRKRVSELEA